MHELSVLLNALYIKNYLEEKIKEIKREQFNSDHGNQYWTMSLEKILGLETEKPLKERLIEKFEELHPLNYEHLAEVAIEFLQAERKKE